MGSLFDDNKKNNLRLRAELDRIEAESEIRQREEGSGYKIKISEGARSDLEKLAAFLRQPPEKLIPALERQEIKRFEGLKESLNSALQNPPEKLKLAVWKLGSEGCGMPSVFAILDSGEIVKLFQIVSADHWTDLKAKSTNDYEISFLQRMSEEKVTTGSVTGGPGRDIAYCVHEWLDRYFPRLSECKLEFIEEDTDSVRIAYEKQQLKRALLRPGVLSDLAKRLDSEIVD